MRAEAGLRPRRISVYEQRQQPRRVVGRRTRAAILARHARDIELIDDLHHEAPDGPRATTHRPRAATDAASLDCRFGNDSAGPLILTTDKF